jgi:hypothetical protein
MPALPVIFLMFFFSLGRAPGKTLGKLFLTTIEKMMSSSYWSETSSSSCGTQQPTEVLQCQPQHYHYYHQPSQAQQPPEKNVVYERVRTYSGPMNKVVQALDPLGSREVLSPLKPASSYQSLVWSDHSQVIKAIPDYLEKGKQILNLTSFLLHLPFAVIYGIAVGGFRLCMC